MTIVRLAWKSLLNRLGSVLLAMGCIALSVALLVGVERTREGAKASFGGTVSDVDLIVGARTGNVQLMLYAVFRMGDAANNFTWQSYQQVDALPQVEWTVPLSLGDSHRGFRVIGTTGAYFEHYRYRDGQSLRLAKGELFPDLFDVVLGAQVAQRLGYDVGDSLVLAHGLGSIALAEHDDLPFRVSGILAPTGTPVDKALHVDLRAIEAIHVDWQSGGVPVGDRTPAERIRAMDLTPRSITATFVGLNSPIATFTTQRSINQFEEEALSAVIPGMALLELWSVVEVVETALSIVTVFVVATALVGMMATLLAMLNDRRREMAILRSVGARPWHLVALLTIEAGTIGLGGALAGVAIGYVGLALAAPWIEGNYGLGIGLDLAQPGLFELGIVALVTVSAVIFGLVPACSAYRRSIADGINVRN